MMDLSRRKKYGGNALTTIQVGMLFVIAALVMFIAPYVRDISGALLSKTSIRPEYALLSRSALVERLAKAEQELAKIHYQSLLYSNLVAEYSSLEHAYTKQNVGSFAAARVIAAPPQTQYDSLTINAGGAQGVRVGDRVTVERFIVGAVTAASRSSSKVELFSNPDKTTDVTIGSRSIKTVVTGEGAGSMSASVPESAGVKVGDAVVDTASGLVLGIVQTVTAEQSSVSSHLGISLPVSWQNTRFVDLSHREL